MVVYREIATILRTDAEVIMKLALNGATTMRADLLTDIKVMVEARSESNRSLVLGFWP